MAGKQLLCLLLSLAVVTAASDAISSAGASAASTEFIRTSCSFTLYPDLCFSSLARYASAVQQDPVQLARAASNVSLSRIRAVLDHVDSIRVAEQRTMAAVRDCGGVLREAMDRTRGAAKELAALEQAVGEEVAFRVGNAQTWMSAALTNEETCTDGFDKVAAGGVRDDVCGRVGRVKQFTSNALALVNHLVASRCFSLSSSCLASRVWG